MAISSSSEAFVFLALRLPSRVIYYVFFSFSVFFFYHPYPALPRTRIASTKTARPNAGGFTTNKIWEVFLPDRSCALRKGVQQTPVSVTSAEWRHRSPDQRTRLSVYSALPYVCLNSCKTAFILFYFFIFWFWFPRGVKSSRSRGMQSRWCLLAWRRERACVTSPVLPLGIFMSWSECVFFFRKNFIDLEICSVMFVCSPNVSYLHRSRDLFSYVRLFTECSIWSYCAMQAEITLRSKSF